MNNKMINLDAKSRQDLTWDDYLKRYRYTDSNKLVSPKEIFGIIKREQSIIKTQINNLVSDVINKKITFADWQRQSAIIIKDAHVNAARLGRGGRENTYGIHYLEVGNELRKNQYPAFRKLAEQMNRGELSEAQIRARVASFIDSSKISYEKARLTHLQSKGDNWVRRRLGSCAPHCEQCIEYATRGWVPISQAVPPGVDCACRGNCCCSLESSKYKPSESKSLY